MGFLARTAYPKFISLSQNLGAVHGLLGSCVLGFRSEARKEDGVRRGQETLNSQIPSFGITEKHR